EARPLPAEAQFAPAFYAGVADLDGDGHEDVFLAQNFFPTDLATSRYDAGRGLVLRGRGDGTLEPVPGQVSGILVYGDQRGGALQVVGLEQGKVPVSVWVRWPGGTETVVPLLPGQGEITIRRP